MKKENKDKRQGKGRRYEVTEHDKNTYFPLSLNEQMTWLGEEIERIIKTNKKHEVRKPNEQGVGYEYSINRGFSMIKEDPKNKALLREIERAEKEWWDYVDDAPGALSDDEILTYWNQYMWAYCAEVDWQQSRTFYFLMRGYDLFHDGDEWIGIYDNRPRLRIAYHKAVQELEEEHKKYDASDYTKANERVKINIFDQSAGKWKYDVPYETLFPEEMEILLKKIEIPKFL